MSKAAKPTPAAGGSADDAAADSKSGGKKRLLFMALPVLLLGGGGGLWFAGLLPMPFGGGGNMPAPAAHGAPAAAAPSAGAHGAPAAHAAPAAHGAPAAHAAAETKHGAPAKDAHGAPPKPDPVKGGPTFFEMPDIIANLNGASKRTVYVKVKPRLELASAMDEAGVRAALPRLLDLFQTYLREMRPEELRGSVGTYRLREELLARANIATAPARIVDVLFAELLIQ